MEHIKDSAEIANLATLVSSVTEWVKSRKIGKHTRTDMYVHRSLIDLHFKINYSLDAVWSRYCVTADPWNVAKLSVSVSALSLLSYPCFDSVAHPALAFAMKIDFESGRVSVTDYRQRDNQPILHRKELLVAADYPRHGEFQTLTVREEEAGLLTDAHRIGYKTQWEQRLKEEGFTIDGHSLCG